MSLCLINQRITMFYLYIGLFVVSITYLSFLLTIINDCFNNGLIDPVMPDRLNVCRFFTTQEFHLGSKTTKRHFYCGHQ